MNTMIAQATSFSPPIEIAGWLACAAFLIAMINGAMKLVDRFKDKPHPSDVQRESAEKFASKTEFEKHTAWDSNEHEKLWSKVGGVERGANGSVEKKLSDLREERQKDMDKLHDHINGVGLKVAGLEKSTELQNQTLANVTSDIKRILERLPRAHS